jgi:YVTN family beta-propeller protein
MFLTRLAAASLMAIPAATTHAESPQFLAVSGRDQLALHDLATGAELARFDAKGGSSDMAALPGGVVLSNHTSGNAVLLLDVKKSAEIGRIPSSSMGGTRPVHMYLTPSLAGKQFVVVLNDGREPRTGKAERPSDSTLLLIDAVQGSRSFLQPAGETRLGAGHHKVGFSMRRPRFAASNMADCADVVSVYDYANPSEIRLIKTFSAGDLGYDGSTPAKSCDETGKRGQRLSPHGTGTSAASGHVYHFLTGTGQIAIFDIDAETPTVKLLQTSGSGGASVKDLPGGRFMVVPQRGPRELHQKADGAPCQIGQLAVIDAMDEKLAAELPVFYGEPGCRTSLAGTPQERAALQYAMPSPDGRTLFVQVGALYAPPAAAPSSSIVAVFDVGDPYRPAQLPSIAVGAGDGTRDHAITGDGKLLIVPNNIDNSVSVIDVATRQVARTFATVVKPQRVVAFGDDTGPSKPVGPATLASK